MPKHINKSGKRRKRKLKGAGLGKKILGSTLVGIGLLGTIAPTLVGKNPNILGGVTVGGTGLAILASEFKGGKLKKPRKRRKKRKRKRK